MIRLIWRAVALVALTGCAPIQPPEPASDHPANPRAAGAADAQLSGVLDVDERNLPRTPPEMRRGMMHHDHGQMSGETSGANKPEHGQRGRYTCPMHPGAVADMPGKCPECGMELTPKGGANDE